MIELQPNTLYTDIDNNRKIRLLYCMARNRSEGERVVYVIRADGGATMPYEEAYETFVDLIEEGIYQKIEEPAIRLPISPTKKQREAAEQAWKLIGGFVSDEPLCYIKKNRARFIAQKAKEVGCQRTKISRLLHRYWEGGMTRDALIPQYDKRGGEGDSTRFKAQSLGRKVQKQTDNLRITIGEKERNQIKYVVDKYYNAHTKYNYRGCYQELLNRFYRNEDGSYAPAYPTYEQFYYHARKIVDPESRIGKKKYAQNYRGLPGRGANALIGPGSLAQMDSTILDCTLVLPGPGRKVIGRPTLYIMVDVFSRLIMGFYLTIADPSWECAKNLLYNVAMDKVEFCAQNGVNIEQDEWPCAGLPRKILTDNGECGKRNGDLIPLGVGIELQTASSYRPDMKGAVERCFRMINEMVRMWLPGGVQPDAQERGVRDYRRDACLTVSEMRKVIIRCICACNHRTMEAYPQDAADLQVSGVVPMPVDIWQWGIGHRGGALRSCSQEWLKYYLLTQGKARITAQGIRFRGLYYTCQSAVREGWFATARQKSTWEVQVSYDPNRLDQIYIYLEETKGPERCDRILRDDEKYQGYSLMEYMAANDKLKGIIAKGKAESERYQAAAQQEIRKIAECATRRMASEPERRAPVKNVRRNRQEAQRAEQEQMTKEVPVLEQKIPEIHPEQVARQVPLKEDKQSVHYSLYSMQEKTLENDSLLTGWGSDDDEI